MPLVCLIGRHGSGKSTIGAALAPHGFKHISVGALRRLAINGAIPVDVPYSLLSALKRTRPGQPLQLPVAHRLLDFALGFSDCVIDGFPSISDHLALLPEHARIAYIWAPRLAREERLVARAAATSRLWVPGRPSERESNLSQLVRESRRLMEVGFFSNAGTTGEVQSVAKRLVNWTKDRA